MGRVELLAPAGNMAALHAAVRAGADAVYLGLESFNARRGADNFTIETLEEACAYAHLRGVKVYVTMNTVVLPLEVDEALEDARQAFRVGADAFIVQDVGLAAELARTLPEARLHISTQMNTHNAAGIRAAARLGAARVTLARELSLDEVAALASEAQAYGMEVETFAHGALCVCYSGQCFMSSMIGGRSANRGMCAQACRLPYELRNSAQRKSLPSPGEHLLSPRDLCTVDLLADLVRAGVSSLKIEGRMKSPEYVSSVTAVYRAALDRVLEGASSEGVAGDLSQGASEQERDALAASFSRGFTTAYLEGKRDNDIMSYQRPNNRGQFIGRVSAVRDGRARIASNRSLVAGDVIEFWTKKGHTALSVAQDCPRRDGEVSVALGDKARMVRASDRVFRVRSAEAAFADDVLAPRIPLAGRAIMRAGEPLCVEFWPVASSCVEGLRGGEAAGAADAGNGVARAIARRLDGQFSGSAPRGIAYGPLVEPARTKPVSPDDVRAHVDRLGSTPFVLTDLDVEVDPGVGMGFSAIHHCRADALENLQDALLEGRRRRVLPRVLDREVEHGERRKATSVVAWATNPTCARAAKRAGADVVYVPALNLSEDTFAIAGQVMGQTNRVGYPKERIVALPAVDHDACGTSREAEVGFDVWQSVKAGEPVFVESLGALQRAVEVGAVPEVGPHLPVTNALSLQAMRDFGAYRIWLSPELTLRQIEDLGQDSAFELGLTVIGSQELMVTEHCLLMSQGPCSQECATCPRRKSPHYLKDRKGFEFPVVTDVFGRSHLYNSVALDIVPAIPELLAAGVSSFMVDTTLMNGDETTRAVERAVRAVRVAELDGNTLMKEPDTTSGHLYRGVS